MADVKNPNKERLIPYTVPQVRGGEKTIFVGVNGCGYLLERGVTMDLPESVVEVLNHSAQAEAKVIAYENEHAPREPVMNL